ncbi:hypothetical protein Cadr_000027105 [Camelus dromedarius]|uniref:Uncharacterized protein n=1 Tax=Camelus dromedarius TaxID=9838 RepID=A0A5N4C5F6_CAMDR|nr:hypothetical protein Cadr_000027105 [Camelus dromedarius]
MQEIRCGASGGSPRSRLRPGMCPAKCGSWLHTGKIQVQEKGKERGVGIGYSGKVNAGRLQEGERERKGPLAVVLSLFMVLVASHACRWDQSSCPGKGLRLPGISATAHSFGLLRLALGCHGTCGHVI